MQIKGVYANTFQDQKLKWEMGGITKHAPVLNKFIMALLSCFHSNTLHTFIWNGCTLSLKSSMWLWLSMPWCILIRLMQYGLWRTARENCLETSNSSKCGSKIIWWSWHPGLTTTTLVDNSLLAQFKVLLVNLKALHDPGPRILIHSCPSSKICTRSPVLGAAAF